MFTVADELLISGLDDDTKAAVDRYIESRQYMEQGKPSRSALRRSWERGYKAALTDARNGSKPAIPDDLKEVIFESERLTIYQEGWKAAAANAGDEMPTALPLHLRTVL